MNRLNSKNNVVPPSPAALAPVAATTTTVTADPADATNGSSPNNKDIIESESTTSLVAASRVKDNQQLQPTKAEMARKIAKQHKKWNKRLKIFFCCLGYKKNKDSIADVASIFAEFYADLKVPSSDIAAGFVLLSKYQAAQRQWIVRNSQLGVEQYLNGIAIKVDTKFLDLSTADDSHLVNDLIYYLNYSLAIFGWPMHLVDDPCLLCCIYPYLKLSPCSSSNSKSWKRRHSSKNNTAKDVPAHNQSDGESIEANKERENLNGDKNNGLGRVLKKPTVGQLDEACDIPIILEDNCCSCNVASAERRLAKHNYDIIYVSYKVNVNVVPFLVAADHSKQAIVVAIRGSMSLSDMVTDMNGQIDRVPIKDCPDDWLCHRGITRAAMYVKLTLEQERIIERAKDCRPDLGSRNYTLVLCGHSLGAGAAAILGVLMRPQYPTLKAYLYSPPGGVLSMPVVEYTKEFAIGVILGNDTVPRLGVAQLERLRYHTLLSIKSAEKSTGKILAKALCPTCCFGDNEVEYDPVQSLDLLHGTEGRSFDYKGTRIPFQSQSQLLYVPGRLIHVVKNYSFQSKKTSKKTRLWSGPIYQAVWTDNSMYDRVIISEGMFFDHLPNKLMQAMKMLFSKTLPARRDSRSSSNAALAPVELQLESNDKQAENDAATQDVIEKIEVATKLNQNKINMMQDYDNNNMTRNDSNNNNYEDDDNKDNNNNQPDGKAFPNLNTKQEQQVEVIKKNTRYEDMASVPTLTNSNKLVSMDENGNEKF